MSLQRMAVAIGVFSLTAIPTLVLGYLSFNPATSIGLVAVIGAGLLVWYRGDSLEALRTELTVIMVGAVVLYAGFTGELLLGVIAGCAIYVTSFITGPRSTLRHD